MAAVVILTDVGLEMFMEVTCVTVSQLGAFRNIKW